MLLQFTSLSVFLKCCSFLLVYCVYLYTRCCSLPLQAIDHCFALMQVSDWVSEPCTIVVIVVCVLRLVFIFTLFLLARPCFLLLSFCCFVSVCCCCCFSFPVYWNVAHFVPFFYSISKHKWKEEKTTVWLNVIHFGYSSLKRMCAHLRAHSWVRFFVLLYYYYHYYSYYCYLFGEFSLLTSIARLDLETAAIFGFLFRLSVCLLVFSYYILFVRRELTHSHSQLPRERGTNQVRWMAKWTKE